jgi:alpha-glucoside transport system substrate-binding protein
LNFSFLLAYNRRMFETMRRCSLLLLVGLLLAACGARPTPIPTPEPLFSLAAPTPTARPPDAPLFVLGHFSGAAEQPMRDLLERFAAERDITVEYEGNGDVAERLRALVIEGRTPDVILLPKPNWLREMAAAGAIPALSEEVTAEVRANFGPAWVDLVSYEGELYGIPLDANAKSLLWYRPAAFEEWNAEPPGTFDELLTLAGTIEAEGIGVFAVPGEPGWPLTDWFESVLLATAGPETYDDLAAHRVPWTDPAVEEAAAQFVSLLRDDWLMGGAERAVTMPLRAEPFRDAFDPDDPGAAMWLGHGGGVRSLISQSGLEESDFGFFPLPASGGIVGIGSVAVGTNDSEATMDLLNFLAQPEAVEPWVEAGGFTSPNLEVPLDSYPTELARQEAALIREAPLFRYDLSDLLPPNLQATLYDQLRAMLLQPEALPAILAEIEQIAHREQGAATGQ